MGGLANKFPGVGIPPRERFLLLMGRIPTVASTSQAPPISIAAPAASPVASGSILFDRIAPSSDLPSFLEEITASRLNQQRNDGAFSSEDEVVTLAVLGGNGAAAKRTSELLTDLISEMPGISIDDPKGVLGKHASGKGELAAVVKAAELVSGVKVGSEGQP